jgi:hypothetical protein
MKLIIPSAIVAIILAVFAFGASAQDTQAELASKTAKFEKIVKTDASVTAAMDAHDLRAAAALVGKDGSFKGTVTKLYTPKSGSLVILNFDRDYKTALTAVVKRAEFGKFPDLSKLEGKRVLVTGKFVDFKGATEMDLTSPDQVKIIE